MKKTYITKIVIFLIVVCIIGLIGYVCIYQKKVKSGSGTFDDPYLVLDCKDIEKDFKKYYETDLLISTEMNFNESTNLLWKANDEEILQDIVIERIQYFGKERLADLMIIISRNRIDKNLSQYLDTHFSHNEKMVTTSQLDMNFDFKNDNKKTTHKTLFVQRLANEVLNNSKMIIIKYKIKIDHEWFKAETMVLDKSFQHIFIPNDNYGKGEIYVKDRN